MNKDGILRFLSASAFIATLPLSAISADWDMSENFTATTETAVNEQIYKSPDTFTGSFNIDGNNYSIIADGGVDETALSGVRPKGWIPSAVIENVGDASKLDIYNVDGSLKYDADTANIISNKEGLVGFSGAIIINGNLTLKNSIIMDSLYHPNNTDYAAGAKAQGAFYIENSYFINNAGNSSAFRGTNNTDGAYIKNSYFYGNDVGVSLSAKNAPCYDNVLIVSANDFQYNTKTSLSIEGAKATLTENSFTNNIEGGTLLYLNKNAFVNATDTIFSNNIIKYYGVEVQTGSTGKFSFLLKFS